LNFLPSFLPDFSGTSDKKNTVCFFTSNFFSSIQILNYAHQIKHAVLAIVFLVQVLQEIWQPKEGTKLSLDWSASQL
jgi:hypothetical protein